MCIVLEIYEDEDKMPIYDVLPLNIRLERGQKIYVTKQEFTIKKLS
jgi:hypothetical protein